MSNSGEKVARNEEVNDVHLLCHFKALSTISHSQRLESIVHGVKEVVTWWFLWENLIKMLSEVLLANGSYQKIRKLTNNKWVYLLVVELVLDSNISCLKFLILSGVTRQKQRVGSVRLKIRALTLVLKFFDLPATRVLVVSYLGTTHVEHVGNSAAMGGRWLGDSRSYHFSTHFLNVFATVRLAPVNAWSVLHDVGPFHLLLEHVTNGVCHLNYILIKLYYFNK